MSYTDNGNTTTDSSSTDSNAITYKTRKCTRDAVKRYKNKIKEDPEKYALVKQRIFEYNRNYYKKLKEARALMQQLEQTLNANKSK